MDDKERLAYDGQADDKERLGVHSESDGKSAEKNSDGLNPCATPWSTTFQQLDETDDDLKKKGELLKETLAAEIVPGIVSQKQTMGLSNVYDSKVTESLRKGFKDIKNQSDKMGLMQWKPKSVQPTLQQKPKICSQPLIQQVSPASPAKQKVTGAGNIKAEVVVQNRFEPLLSIISC